MYRIMLADDEGIVIESLKFIIEKEFGDECEVEFAKTGRSVIELAERFRPDIAVMDIQMPGINGIDAMQEIRAGNSSIIFIVMSAYDKFDYAKEAIKLGVLEYITKPMEKTRIVAALKKAMEIIDKDREKRSNDLMIRERLENVVPILETGLIYDVLLQEPFKEDIDSFKSALGIEQSYSYMIALVYGDEVHGSHLTNAVGSSVKIQQFMPQIRDALKEGFPGCIVGVPMSNKIAVMIPTDESGMNYNDRIGLIEKSREMAKNLRKMTDIVFRIGIGSVKKMGEARESYQEALEALTKTTGSVAHADDLPLRCEYEDSYPLETEKQIFEAVESGDVARAQAAAGSYFDWMIENYPDSDTEIQLKVLEFVLWAEHLAYMNGGMTYVFNTRRDYIPTVTGAGNLAEIKPWFLDKIGEAARNIGQKSSEKSMSIIETAREFIDKNYGKDISLDEVSRTVDISPYYFSKIFKEDTGEGFVEYLTRVRIDRAKELLTTTECSMKEICGAVGYSDPNYFSRIFKKTVGITPTEYKEHRA